MKIAMPRGKISRARSVQITDDKLAQMKLRLRTASKYVEKYPHARRLASDMSAAIDALPDAALVAGLPSEMIDCFHDALRQVEVVL
jgi:hypothetical protein